MKRAIELWTIEVNTRKQNRSRHRPSLLVAICTSRQSCCRAGKAGIFTPLRKSSMRFRFKEVNEMKTPGFSAETSLYKTRGRYDCVAMSGCSKGRRDVISQLKGSVFHRPLGGGGLGTLEDYWICREGCQSAYSACVERCEGLRCLNCDGDY